MAKPRAIPAIDADGHVQEPPEAWEGLEPALRALAPRHWIDEQGRPRQLVGGELRPLIPSPAGGWEVPAGVLPAFAHHPQASRWGSPVRWRITI